MKKVILVTMSMLVSLGLLTGCGKKKTDNPNNGGNTGNNPEQEEIKTNTNEDVVGDKQVETLKFEETSLIYDGNSTLETLITNVGTETVIVPSFNIHVMNGDTEIVELHGFIGGSIEPGESILFSSTYGSDITMATSINYEIVR